MEFLKGKLRDLINIYGDIYKLVRDEKTNLIFRYLKYYSLTDTKNLHAEVDTHLKNVKLSETVTNVVIPSFRVSKAMPLIFTNHLRVDEVNKSSDIALKDAILSSAAAPAYFPPHLFKFRAKEEMFFDGGLGANNPVKFLSNYLNKSSTVNNTVDFQMSRFFHKHPRNYLRIEKYDLTSKQADMCNGDVNHIEELKDIAENLLFNERVKVVDPYTGTKEETEESYIDALKEFAEKLVEEKRRRDKANGKLAATVAVQYAG